MYLVLFDGVKAQTKVFLILHDFYRPITFLAHARGKQTQPNPISISGSSDREYLCV